jgi:hypothetical protein
MTVSLDLRQRLAELYPTSNDARRIAQDAGVDTTRVDFQGGSLATWANILPAADNQQRLPQLLAAITKENPAVRGLTEGLANEGSWDALRAPISGSIANDGQSTRRPDALPDVDTAGGAELIKQFASRTKVTLDSFFKLRSEATSFTALVENGVTFWIAAKGVSGFLNRNAKVIERAAGLGKRFRFLLHDPNNLNMLYAISSNSYSNKDGKKLKSMILGAIDQLKKIGATCPPGAVEVKLAQAPLYNGYTIVNGESATGIVYLEMFGYKTSLDERMTLTISRDTAPKLYSYHIGQFTELWKDSKPT